MPRECTDCGAGLGARNVSGLCVCCSGRRVGKSNAMPKQMCANCGAACARSDARYCSRGCYDKHFAQPTGSDSPSWRGDDVGEWGARRRTQRTVPARSCEVCGSPNADRHHIDRNILNNAPSNIAHLCRRHHTQTHHGTLGVAT